MFQMFPIEIWIEIMMNADNRTIVSILCASKKIYIKTHLNPKLFSRMVQNTKICLAAVSQYGNALQYVHEQTPEICLAAVRQSRDFLQYIN
jgi:uncharacterized pyridoxamine 5'-phosphate oxidase family protein